MKEHPAHDLNQRYLVYASNALPIELFWAIWWAKIVWIVIQMFYLSIRIIEFKLIKCINVFCVYLEFHCLCFSILSCFWLQIRWIGLVILIGNPSQRFLVKILACTLFYSVRKDIILVFEVFMINNINSDFSVKCNY